MKKVSFEAVKEAIEKILPNPDKVSWNLLPEDISMLAEHRGYILEWKPLSWWPDFEIGKTDINNDIFLDELFKEKTVSGLTYVITDECWTDKKGISFDFKNVNDVIEEYEEHFQLAFFQTSDIIFVNPEVGVITFLHHSGYKSQY